MFMIRIAILPATAALVKCGLVTRLFMFAFRCKRVTLLVLHAVCIAVVLRLSRSRTRLALAMITRPTTRLPARCHLAMTRRCREIVRLNCFGSPLQTTLYANLFSPRRD